MNNLPYSRIGAALSAGRQPTEYDVNAIRTAMIDLKPIDVSVIYQGLADAGCMDTEIARIACRTLRHVTTLLVIAAAPELIKSMIRNGLVTAAEGYKAIRESGGLEQPAIFSLQAVVAEKAIRASLVTGTEPFSALQSAMSMVKPKQVKPATVEPIFTRAANALQSLMTMLPRLAA